MLPIPARLDTTTKTTVEDSCNCRCCIPVRMNVIRSTKKKITYDENMEHIARKVKEFQSSATKSNSRK